MKPHPIYVDLDGTLIQTDMLYESAVALMKRNPFYVFLFPIWLLHGKAYLKKKIADLVDIDVSCLPYNDKILKYLSGEREKGRRIVLCTASDAKFANQISSHVGIFDEVFSSNGIQNNAGHRKLRYIIDQHGKKGFDYAGNADVDLAIWREADTCVVVNATKSTVRRAQTISKKVLIFEKENSFLQSIPRVLRIHQWSKNILVFIPLVLAHKFGDFKIILEALLAFFSFSLMASAIYILNDLFDLEYDRNHQRKKDRPIASGDFPIIWGIGLIPVLILGSCLISLYLLRMFSYLLALYLFTTIVYSSFLKRIVLLDVITLAALYTVRIIAGAEAVNVPISPWLLAFSMFLFLSLAFVKRFSELQAIRQEKNDAVKGRGYYSGALEQIAILGTSSGYISILVLALYINGEEVVSLYSKPMILWMICPLFLYWISRVWILVNRGVLHDDPIVFAMKDKVSYLVGILIASVILVAL